MVYSTRLESVHRKVSWVRIPPLPPFVNMNTSYKNIDDYIASFPKDVQKVLESVRQTIKKAAPLATEKISYQMPTFYLNGNLVHFAACKGHLGFYPTPSPILAFKKDLSNYVCTKGSVHFLYGNPLPIKLIQKIVLFRVKQNLAKTKS